MGSAVEVKMGDYPLNRCLGGNDGSKLRSSVRSAVGSDMSLFERDGLKVDSSMRSATVSAVEMFVRGENDASIVGSSVTSK